MERRERKRREKRKRVTFRTSLRSWLYTFLTTLVDTLLDIRAINKAYAYVSVVMLSTQVIIGRPWSLPPKTTPFAAGVFFSGRSVGVCDLRTARLHAVICSASVSTDRRTDQVAYRLLSHRPSRVVQAGGRRCRAVCGGGEARRAGVLYTTDRQTDRCIIA